MKKVFAAMIFVSAMGFYACGGASTEGDVQEEATEMMNEMEETMEEATEEVEATMDSTAAAVDSTMGAATEAVTN